MPHAAFQLLQLCLQFAVMNCIALPTGPGASILSKQHQRACASLSRTGLVSTLSRGHLVLQSSSWLYQAAGTCSLFVMTWHAKLQALVIQQQSGQLDLLTVHVPAGFSRLHQTDSALACLQLQCHARWRWSTLSAAPASI